MYSPTYDPLDPTPEEMEHRLSVHANRLAEIGLTDEEKRAELEKAEQKK